MTGERVVVGIDVGTTKVCTLIGEARNGHQVEVVGVGVCPSRGLRKGLVVDMDEAVAAIAASLKKAEVFSGYRITGAFVAVSGSYLDSDLAHGGLALPGDRPVSREDLAAVLEAARVEEVPEGRQVLHVIPRGYVVDGEGGIHNPVGMRASRLEVEGLVVSSAEAALQNVRRCVERAGIQVDGFVSAGLASAEAVLSDVEAKLGVLLMDMGGGTTDLAVFRDGEPHYVGALPFGGYHVTNDLSVCLGLPFSAAEEAKLRFASAVPENVAEDDMVDVEAITHEGKPCLVSRRLMAEIVEARMLEVFDLALDELKSHGQDGVLPAGLVMTGGAAQLRGLRELAQRSLDMPVRVGLPVGLAGSVDSLSTPAYATGAGLLKWIPAEAARTSGNQMPPRQRSGLGQRLKGLVRAFLP